MIDAFPLHWPVGYKRTPESKRKHSAFKQTMEASQRFLRLELDRMGARNLVISTNIPVRKDGGLYADYMSRKLDDPGVAIYFKYQGKDITMCCDQYLRVWENIYALGKGIEALRGMERWGVSDFLERAFTGFTAIPETVTAKTCWDVLDLQPTRDEELIKRQYRQLSKSRHPDAGGSHELFNELTTAYVQAINYTKQ